MKRVLLTPGRAALLAALLALVVYLNILPNAFVIDDEVMTIRNTFLREPGGLKKILTTNAWAALSQDLPINFYRPLMHATLWVWWRMFHANPAGYHLLSLLLHAAVSLLVFVCLRRIGQPDAVALLAAVLFAVHPIHTEAVAWISAFPDLESSLFVLLGFWLYLRAEKARGWRRYALETGLALSVLLALVAKEIGVVLPFLVLLYELFARRRAPLELLRSRAFAYAGIGVACVAYLAMRWHALGGLMPVAFHFPGTRWQLLAGWSRMLFDYTVRLLFPVQLSAFHVICGDGHPWPSFSQPATLAGIAIAVGLIVLAMRLYRRRRLEWLGVALFIAALAPSFPAGIKESGIWLGERYLYLPSVGFCWLLAALIWEIASRNHRPEIRRVTLVFVVGLLSLYSVRTLLRIQEWRDEAAFYERELRTEGESPHLRALLVDVYLKRGMPQPAAEHAQAAVRLGPRDARAHNLLGFAYWALGRPEESLAQYRQAAGYARQAGDARLAARALNNIAVAYSNTGRLDLAIPHYREAARLDPAFAEAENNLALALYQTGNSNEAIEQLRLAIRANPRFTAAYANLGLMLAVRRDLPAARAALEEALRLEPQNAENIARLGAVQLLAGEAEAARRSFNNALSLDPANARAFAGLKAVGQKK